MRHLVRRLFRSTPHILQVSFDAPELVVAARKQHGPGHVIQHVVDLEEVQEKMADLLKK